MTAPRILTGIPAQFQHVGTIFGAAASSAVNRHGATTQPGGSRNELEPLWMRRISNAESRTCTRRSRSIHKPDIHFEMGRAMASPARIHRRGVGRCACRSRSNRSPALATTSDLANLRAGEHVVDLGSGSGMDSFIAAHKVGVNGQVTGIDMTDAQLAKADRLGKEHAFMSVRFRHAFIDATGLPDQCCDVVISNGVINLSPDKDVVFREAARLLRSGGRLALADIVTGVPLPETVSCDATLWAACIGGAMQRDAYVEAIENAGFTVTTMKANDEYRFLSRSAQNATRDYGVHSVSLLAIRN